VAVISTMLITIESEFTALARPKSPSISAVNDGAALAMGLKAKMASVWRYSRSMGSRKKNASRKKPDGSRKNRTGAGTDERYQNNFQNDSLMNRDALPAAGPDQERHKGAGLGKIIRRQGHALDLRAVWVKSSAAVT